MIRLWWQIRRRSYVCWNWPLGLCVRGLSCELIRGKRNDDGTEISVLTEIYKLLLQILLIIELKDWVVYLLILETQKMYIFNFRGQEIYLVTEKSVQDSFSQHTWNFLRSVSSVIRVSLFNCLDHIFSCCYWLKKQCWGNLAFQSHTRTLQLVNAVTLRKYGRMWNKKIYTVKFYVSHGTKMFNHTMHDCIPSHWSITWSFFPISIELFVTWRGY